MNEERTDDERRRGEEPTPDDDAALAALMSLAGSRRDIPELIERRVRANVQAEWRRATAVRRTLRWAAPLAVAASVVLAWFIIPGEPVTAPVTIGTVAKVVDDASGLGVGDRLFVSDTLSTTAAGGLTFALDNQTSVRLARSSSLRIDAADEFTLMAGAVYVDTGELVYRDDAVTVSTDFGTVTDIGTQFAVSLGQSAMQVAVREGRVDIATGRQTIAAMAGNRVTVASDTSTTLDNVSPVAADWDWAEELAPGFAIDGKSVLEFLKWVARETGMELEFASEEDRRAAMASRLHGSIGNLTPMEALASVMSTTSFEYEIDGDAISVRR